MLRLCTALALLLSLGTTAHADPIKTIPSKSLETVKKVQVKADKGKATGAITNGLVAFLDADDWKYTIEKKGENHNIVTFSFTGKNGTLKSLIIIRENIGFIAIYSRLEVTVPVAKRTKVAEFITRVNYGLRVGNFEMDFNDGEVRYKASGDFEKTTTSKTTFRNLLHANLSTADRYYPALMKLIYSDALTPEAAVALIEKKKKK